MDHLSEDTAIKHLLGLLNEDEKIKTDNHVRYCDKCRELLEEIETGLIELKEIEPAINPGFIPLPDKRKPVLYTLLKVAAILLVGFISGFELSRNSCRRVITIAPHQKQAVQPVDTTSGFTKCEPVDIQWK